MKKLIFTLLTILTLSSSFFTSLYATNVSGGIYSNTTWTLNNSPYIVTDTIVVFPGVTLTIEPGVVVKFDSLIYIEIRQATLIANGTITDSIKFTSNSNNPYPGIWNYVALNSASNSIINYCSFQFANVGLGDIGFNTLIKNCNFINNLTGLSTYNNVDSCNFTNNTSYGLESSNNMTVTNCNIEYNDVGCGLNGSSLRNCNIKYNTTGIQNSGITIDSCTISNNVIGLYDNWFQSMTHTLIENSIIDSNSNIGIILGQNDTLINCQISNSRLGVTDSTHLSAYYCLLTTCSIENNVIGIKVENWTETFYCNKICNNTDYDFYYDESYCCNYPMPENYWCSSDSAIIHSHIYDGYININKGLVFVTPIDTIGCYLNNIFTGIYNSPKHQNTTINIYPNPNNGSFEVVYHLPVRVKDFLPLQFIIFDVMGREVYNVSLKGIDGMQNIDATSLNKGIYYWEIPTNQGIEGKGKMVFVGD